MPDYEKMYNKLFNSVTDVIDALQKAQNETEEIFLNSSEDDENKVVKLRVIKGKDPDNL